MERMLTVKEVQDNLGIGTNNTYKLIKTPNFPKIRIGNKYLIPETQYNEWVQKSIKNKVEILL